MDTSGFSRSILRNGRIRANRCLWQCRSDSTGGWECGEIKRSRTLIPVFNRRLRRQISNSDQGGPQVTSAEFESNLAFIRTFVNKSLFYLFLEARHIHRTWT